MLKNLSAPNLKETSELVDSAFNTTVQAIEVASDNKFEIIELAKFFDEAVQWEGALRGLVTGFPAEAKIATPADVENLFDAQFKKLTGAGVNPMLAGAIVSGLKGSYYTYCAIVQAGQPVLV